MLAESLIDSQRSNIDHFQDLTKKQWDMIKAKDDKIMKLKQKLVDCKSDSARELQLKEARYAEMAEMVEVKDAEIKTLQDLVSLSERKALCDSISEQKSLADTMIEKLSGACSDKASLNEATEEIAQLKSKLEESLEKASGLQVKLTEAEAKEKSALVMVEDLKKVELKLLSEVKELEVSLDGLNRVALRKKNEFKLPLTLADDDVKQRNYKIGTADFSGFEERIRSSITTILSRSSTDDWIDALKEIRKDCEQMIGKKVHFVSKDYREAHNRYCLYTDSYIGFSVKEKLGILLFTRK